MFVGLEKNGGLESNTTVNRRRLQHLRSVSRCTFPSFRGLEYGVWRETDFLTAKYTSAENL